MVMKPIVMAGHTKPLTRIRTNRDGDLLLSTAKEKMVCLWYSDNGERVGTYEGHKGAVFDGDLSWDSTATLTGGADMQCMLWDTATGRLTQMLNSQSPISSVQFSYSANLFFYVATARMAKQGCVAIFDRRDPEQMKTEVPAISIPLPNTAPAAVWSHLDDTIVVGNEKGHLTQFDLRAFDDDQGASNFDNTTHQRSITDIQMSEDQTLMITSSKDKTAKLWDPHTLEPKKVYKAERPVNSACISPNYDHVIIGGGEEAMKVTQTSQQGGDFQSKFYHLIFEQEFARVKGHFGPINSLCYLPDGETFLSGGEDGLIRMHRLDDDLKSFEMDF